MVLGFLLLWVGAVLFLNGIWLLGQIGDREISVINVFSGFVAAFVAFFWMVHAPNDLAIVRSGALTLLFAFTYLWIAIDRWIGSDGRGLGWYSLFVAITAAPVAGYTAFGETPVLWLGGCWGYWAVLWFMYFLLLTLRWPIQRLTGWVTLVSGIVTGWVTGFMFLYGYIHA